MSWWGKALGGAFGFMIGGPLGALMGIAFGHHFDRGMNRLDEVEERLADLHRTRSELLAIADRLDHLEPADCTTYCDAIQ